MVLTITIGLFLYIVVSTWLSVEYDNYVGLFLIMLACLFGIIYMLVDVVVMTTSLGG